MTTKVLLSEHIASHSDVSKLNIGSNGLCRTMIGKYGKSDTLVHCIRWILDNNPL